MNREKYLADRQALMDTANQLIADGKIDEANEAMNKVAELDNTYDAVAKAQANLNALSGAIPEANPFIYSGTTGEREITDMYESDEYKKAFMGYVMRGEAIPAKFVNADATTKTSDIPVAIPTTTVQKIYEKMENLGMILPLVTQTSYAGGVSVPTSSVKPVASWVSEGTGSDKQKKTVGYISFASYKLRCAVAMTYEVDNMAYPFFESQFVQNVANAMTKAKETAIIKGAGVGQPKGILKETAAANINITEGSKITYADLCKAEGEENDDAAVWVMTKKTYMSQIAGMVDADGQPVARVNMGIGGRPEYSILGRRVVIVNPDYMDTFAETVTADSVVAFLYNFANYIFNSGVALTTKRYYDEDTDDTITKAIEVCDGKSVLNDSLVTVTVKNA